MNAASRGFAEFWPEYLRAHANPGCRAMHYIGTTGAWLGAAAAILDGRAWWLPLGATFAYGMAWIGHFFVERNRPATFANPVWSLVGDFRMYGLWLTGRLKPELDRALIDRRD